MATSTPASKPTPERIFNTMVAFQETEALKAAIELDIFTAIAEGANTAESLAAKTGTSERGMRDGIERIDAELLAEGFGRFVKFLLLLEREAEIVVRGEVHHLAAVDDAACSCADIVDAVEWDAQAERIGQGALAA